MKQLLSALLLCVSIQSFSQSAQLLMDINPGSDGSFEFSLKKGMIEYDDKLFFGANDGTNGVELWVYDGQTTSLVADINPGAAGSDCDNFFVLNGKLIFTAETDNEGSELWVSDGTAEGTERLTDLATGGQNGVSSCCSDPISKSFIVFNNELYFNGSTDGSNSRLYKTDGTTDGTVEIAMLNGNQRRATSFEIHNGELFFGVVFGGFWKTDGTTDGTVLIKEKDHEDDRMEPIYLYDMGDYLIMVNGFDWDLWRSDGTEAGTTLIRDMVRPEAQNNQGRYFFNYKGNAYFSGSDAFQNTEMWRSDGTEGGTYMVADIELNPGFIPIYPRKKVMFKDLMYYIGGNGDTGFQIYKTDGTEAGTEELINLNDTNNGQVYFQSDLIATDKVVFFIAGRPFNRELWYTDGTAEGTHEIEVHPSGESTPERLFVYKDKLIFFANGNGVGYEPHYVDINEIMVASEDLGLDTPISVFPNPGNDKIYVQTELVNYELTLYNLQSKRLLVQKNNPELDVKQFPAGNYFLKILDLDERKYHVEKISLTK